MTFDRRELLRHAAAIFATAMTAGRAHAQVYPSRPVRVIVPVGPGGQNDTTTRLIAQKLSENLATQFYVENHAGGSSNLGTQLVARAPADGYTVLAMSGNFVINPSLYAKIPFDPIADFAPVTLMCSSPHVLVVHPLVPAATIGELIAQIKAHPGEYSYSSAGPGTPAHLAGELFRLAFGLDLVHVPYTSGGAAMVSTMGGHTRLAFSAVPSAVSTVKAGNVRALAVMGARRSSAMPDVPTMAEATGTDLQADIVNGLLLPAGTPAEIVALLHREVVRVMAQADVKERLAGLGFETVTNTPQEFALWIKSEIGKWGKVIRDAGIHAQ
jgi:tripartite-type tricarboxylate transporter receptor subunit TctC